MGDNCRLLTHMRSESLPINLQVITAPNLKQYSSFEGDLQRANFDSRPFSAKACNLEFRVQGLGLEDSGFRALWFSALLLTRCI